MDTWKRSLLPEINSTETDYRAEVIAAGLPVENRDEDRALITRKGGNNKGVAKDVSKISAELSDLDLVERLYIHTNRYGIYDSLPEGFFHQSSNRRKNRSQQDVLGDIRAHREKESHARRFFQPFEMAIDGLLVDAQLYEQQFDKAHTHENLKLIFEEHWDILQYLSVKQSLLLLKIIPLVAGAGGDFSLMASIMGVILNSPVKITEGKKSFLEINEKERKILFNRILEVDSVMGKSVRTDFPDLDITIGPTSAKKVRDFQANKNNQVILDKLIEMIVPFDRNVNIRYEVFESEKKFRLSSPAHKAYLGVNTTL